MFLHRNYHRNYKWKSNQITAHGIYMYVVKSSNKKIANNIWWFVDLSWMLEKLRIVTTNAVYDISFLQNNLFGYIFLICWL